jgi:hypothetical protein
MLTGASRDQIGIFEDLAVKVPGLKPFEIRLGVDLRLNPLNLMLRALSMAGLADVFQHPVESLGRRSPVWKLLSDQRIKTAVLRFPFTYPAFQQADYVVSNRIDTE